MKKGHPIIDGRKVCTKCGENKPISEFYKYSNSKDGYHYYCKVCQRTADRISYKKNHTLVKKKREYDRKAYEETDYLPKKYLKRYQASLEKVLKKKEQILEEVNEGKRLTASREVRLLNYDDAIKRWKQKIAEAEKVIADYAKQKVQQEEMKQEEQEPTTVNNMEEQKPTSAHMTKAALINLLSDVPNDARIIYVGDSENRSSLVAAWRSDPHSVCIRNLNASMPYIITDGALYELVSASIPFPECPKKGEPQ